MKNYFYWDMMVVMVCIGILGFGGGFFVILLICYEVVNKYKWIDDDEFGEILVIVNVFFGLIVIKMVVYLGFKLKGMLGVIVVIFVYILFICFVMVGLFVVVNVLSYLVVVVGMIGVVMLVIVVMFGIMVYEFG